MVNGALMLNRDYDLKKHIRKIINIFILMILWAVITLLILAPIKGNNYSILEFAKALWRLESGTINHLWFLQTLVCLYIIYPLIKEVYDKEDKRLLKYIVTVIFIFTFGNVLLNMIANILESILGINYITSNTFNFFNNFNLFRGFYAYSLVYFIIGAVLLEKLNNDMKINAQQMIVIFIIGMSLLFIYGIMMSHSNKEIYDTVWYGYDTIMTLLICLSIFILSFIAKNKLHNASNIIQLIGENTLGIYFLHRIVGSVLKSYYVTFIFSTSILFNLVFGVIVMVISLLITLILKKVPLIKLLFRI